MGGEFTYPPKWDPKTVLNHGRYVSPSASDVCRGLSWASSFSSASAPVRKALLSPRLRLCGDQPGGSFFRGYPLSGSVEENQKENHHSGGPLKRDAPNCYQKTNHYRGKLRGFSRVPTFSILLPVMKKRRDTLFNPQCDESVLGAACKHTHQRKLDSQTRQGSLTRLVHLNGPPTSGGFRLGW